MAKDHWWGFSTRNAHMVHMVKSDLKWCIHLSWSLFYLSTWITIQATFNSLGIMCPYLVHGSHLKQKKFIDTNSLGMIRPYLVRQPVNTRLICQLRGDHALKQLVHGLSLFHFEMAPRLRLGTISHGTWKPWTNLYLVRQHANTPLKKCYDICPSDEGDNTQLYDRSKV